MRVARFVLRVVDAAQHRDPASRRSAGSSAKHSPADFTSRADAERAHRFGVARQRLEIALVGGELQDAALEVVVADAELARAARAGIRGCSRQGRRACGCGAGSGRESIRAGSAAPHSHCARSARGRNSSGASSRPSQRRIFGTTEGFAQGSAWPAEIWPPLANEVSRPAASRRSITVTSWPAAARYQAPRHADHAARRER